MRTLLLPVFAAATLVGLSAPASAGEVTIHVSAAGLDFTRATDIVAMKDRIDSAVSKACSKPTIHGYSSSEAVDACIADGTAKALAQLDAKIAAAD